MRKAVRKEPFDFNMESLKRQRALPTLSPVDLESRLFFERILHVRKFRELVFFTKAGVR